MTGIEAVLEGIARNREQQRLVENPTPEVDSIAECVRALVRTATPEQRVHLRVLIALVNDLCASNQAELACERLVAAALDAPAGPAEWSVRRAREALVAPLDVVVHPVKYTADQHLEARASLEWIVAECPREYLVHVETGEINRSLRRRLRDRKCAALALAIAAADGATA